MKKIFLISLSLSITVMASDFSKCVDGCKYWALVVKGYDLKIHEQACDTGCKTSDKPQTECLNSYQFSSELMQTCLFATEIQTSKPSDE